MNTAVRKPIYTAVAQLPVAAEQRETAIALIDVAKNLAILADPEQVAKAAEWLARARAHWSALDVQRKEMNAGAREAIEALNNEFNGVLNPLKLEIDGMANLILAYNARERQRAEAEQKALRDAEDERQRHLEQERQRVIAETGLEPPPPPAPLHASPTIIAPPKRVMGHAGSSATEKDNWTYEVVDIALVPETYLVPPEERIQKSVLNAIARSQKDKASVPGIRFVNKPILSTRAAR